MRSSPAPHSSVSRSYAFGSVLFCLLLTLAWTGCSQDPNVKKQKYLESGKHYFEEHKYREAAIQFENAVQVDPRFAQAHFQLGETLLKLQDYDHAIAEFSRAVELEPTNYTAQADLANLLIGTHQPEALKQAKLHLDILRENQPTSSDTYAAWSNYDAAVDKVGEALQEMQSAISADPSRADLLLNMAMLQLRANLPDQAEVNFRKAAEVAPKSVSAQVALGGFYQYRGRYAEAEQQFRKAISADANDPQPRASLARLWMAEGKTAEIEPFLKETKAAFPNNSEAYCMLGDYYYQVGDLDKATAEYGSLFGDHPRDMHVKKNYIQLLILKNRVDEATKLNDEILKANTRDVDGLVYRGQIQLHQGNASAAVESLQEALNNDTNNPVARYQLGLAYAAQGDVDRAAAQWSEAVRLKPDMVEALRALGDVQDRRGDAEGLLQTAQQLINAHPPEASGFLMRAIVEIKRQKYNDAENDLNKTIEMAPASPKPYIYLGDLRLKQNQYAEAQKFYQQTLDKDPNSTDGLRGLMAAYIKDKQVDKALEAAKQQIAKSPNNSAFYDLVGTAMIETGKDPKAAEASFRKAVDLDKNNSDALVKLWNVQMKGHTAQALATCQQSIKDNPREVEAYILCGKAYEDQKQWDQAKLMYQQALNIQGDNPEASNNLAYLMLEHDGNVDIALAMAQTARRGHPDQPNFADTLGWAYCKKGVYQSAISLFQEALRLDEKWGVSDDADVYYHLGYAYQKTNKPALAREQFERSLKIRPAGPEADDARKALAELRG